jgi:phage repressor protein C with HTH and peptisase S24 domain
MMKERLIDFLAYLKIGQLKFEENVGLSRGFVNKVGDSIRVENLNKISKTYPELNINWLKTGEGEMLKSAVRTGNETIGLPGSIDITYVPLLPISAQGGTLNDFVVSIKDSDCEKVISPIKGADFAISVAGDSMSPEYPSGSQILIKKINEKAFIDWGKVYVLDTCNGTVIKKIFPSDDKDTEKIKCVSINPEYPPFEIAFSDIHGVYRVLLCMSIK